jgi:hypothetical protein
MRYFFYGSLTDPDVLAIVLGRPRIDGVPAALRGWRRWRVAGACYPLISPAPGGCVEGVVLDASPAEARRLAWYEGEDYDLRELRPTLASGEPVAALVFLPKPDLAHADEPWDPTLWRREHKAALLEAAGRWMSLADAQLTISDLAQPARKAAR